jgi:hypothetical protein
LIDKKAGASLCAEAPATSAAGAKGIDALRGIIPLRLLANKYGMVLRQGLLFTFGGTAFACFAGNFAM